MVNPNPFSSFDGTESRLTKTFALKDSKYTRRDLILRSRELFQTLLDLLPSNYISEVLGPNYTKILNAVASESAFARLSAEDVASDAIFETTRGGFLYRNLGYLLHGNRLTKFNIPQSFSIDKYREFLLGTLAALLGGARAQSVEEGTKIFTNFDAKVVEIFLSTPPRVDDSAYDISNQFEWRLDVEIGDTFDGQSLNLTDLRRGLEFLAEISRPAHTTFDVRFIFTELLRVGRNGCRTILNSDGYLRATNVVVNPQIVVDKPGIFEGVIKGRIEKVDNNLLTVNGVTVNIVHSTSIVDVYKQPVPFFELQVGDLIEVTGIVIDPLLNDGFEVKQKFGLKDFCDVTKFDFVDFQYEDKRFCCSDRIEAVNVTKEQVYNPAIPGNKTFQTLNYPLINAGDKLELATVLDVTAFVNGFDIDVVDLNPYYGTFTLSTAPNKGDVVEISYTYYKNLVTAIKTNTSGLVTNGWGTAVPKGLQTQRLDGSFNNSLASRHRSYLVRDGGIQEDICMPSQVKYEWEGLESRYSALTNSQTTLLTNTWQSNNPNYHKTNSFHVVTNTGSRGSKIGGSNPNFNDFEGSTEIEPALFKPTPSFFKTMDINGFDNNLVFTDPSLNGDEELNADLELNDSNTKIVVDPFRNRYALKFDSNTSTGSGDLAIACDFEEFDFEFGGEEYEDSYTIPEDNSEEQGYLITNYWPMKAIVNSPVSGFEIDFEEQRKHAIQKGLIGWGPFGSKNLSKVTIPRYESEETFFEELDFGVESIDQFAQDHSADFEDFYQVRANNTLITNKFSSVTVILNPATNQYEFITPDEDYINSEFELNSLLSNLNEEADIVGTNPPTTQNVLVGGTFTNTYNTNHWVTAGGGLIDELVEVTLDGGNPWTDITKETEQAE